MRRIRGDAPNIDLATISINHNPETPLRAPITPESITRPRAKVGMLYEMYSLKPPKEWINVPPSPRIQTKLNQQDERELYRPTITL